MADFNEKVQMILRQTIYTYEEASVLLTGNNNDVMAVIRLYLKPPVSKEATPLSMNQQIYKEIRTLMDDNDISKAQL